MKFVENPKRYVFFFFYKSREVYEGLEIVVFTRIFLETTEFIENYLVITITIIIVHYSQYNTMYVCSRLRRYARDFMGKRDTRKALK